MSIFSTNRFKNLSAEYVEESLKLVAEEAEKEETEVKEAPEPKEVKEEAEVKDDTESVEDDVVDEAAYIDSLLESLNEEE